jgi:hypothetical protein
MALELVGALEASEFFVCCLVTALQKAEVK